jgi:acyl CoA:acetate/3-ketoacid CoA transferase
MDQQLIAVEASTPTVLAEMVSVKLKEGYTLHGTPTALVKYVAIECQGTQERHLHKYAQFMLLEKQDAK